MKTLTQLARDFELTGLNDCPPMEDRDLKTYHVRLLEIAEWLRWRNDSTMRFSVIHEAEAVKRMIEAQPKK